MTFPRFREFRKSMFRRFAGDRNGGIAVLFALSLIPLTGLVGAAIDYNRGMTARNHIQDAADAAALAGGRTLADEYPDVSGAAQKVFDENMQGMNDVKITHFSAKKTSDGDNDGVRVEAIGKVDTTFMRILGIEDFDVSAFSEIGVGKQDIEVALVLDNTGSMNSNNKIGTLKTSAKILVNALKPNSNSKDVKFALVPFAKYVNIGMANRNEPGVDVPDDYIVTPAHNHCYNTYPNSTVVWTCTGKEWVSKTCYNDGVPYDCSYWKNTGCTKTGDKGDPVEVCKWKDDKWARWYGCVGSRDTILDVVDDTYTTPVPGLLWTSNHSCKNSAVTRLTDNKGTIMAGISAMKAKDYTYIPTGLMWGWRAISSGIPFADGKPYSKDIQKVIVLMTDGMNTKSPTYPEHNGGDTGLANAKTATLCQNIKAKDIMVFTIAFEVTDPTIKSILSTCAGNGGQYFDATSGEKLKLAFKSIALSLMNLRLTR